MRGRKILVSSLVVGSMLLAACGDDKEDIADAPAASAVEAAPADSAAAAAPAGADIVATAEAAGSFTTLLAAVGAAGLGDTLKGEGPFTVFAPTDEAFAKLPAGLVDKLVAPENREVLTKILTYHVVSGKVMAADIKPGDVATVQGDTIALATEGGVTVNGAKVLTADVAASNGVIHVIDTVMLPPGVDPAAL